MKDHSVNQRVEDTAYYDVVFVCLPLLAQCWRYYVFVLSIILSVCVCILINTIFHQIYN